MSDTTDLAGLLFSVPFVQPFDACHIFSYRISSAAFSIPAFSASISVVATKICRTSARACNHTPTRHILVKLDCRVHDYVARAV